jgi:hypothetical protein
VLKGWDGMDMLHVCITDDGRPKGGILIYNPKLHNTAGRWCEGSDFGNAYELKDALAGIGYDLVDAPPTHGIMAWLHERRQAHAQT